MVQVEPASDAGSPSSHPRGSGLATATALVAGGIIGVGAYDRATPLSCCGAITLHPMGLHKVVARTSALLPVDRRVVR